MNDLVSIIIPTFNRYNYLTRCIKSILKQNDPNFEIIVCDNGSTDETTKIHLDFDIPNIVFIDGTGLPKHPGAMRNLGIKHAKGEIICFLDDDDYWHAGYLTLVREKLQKYDAFGEFEPFLFIRGSKLIKSRHLALSNVLIMSSVGLKKSVLEKVGVFPQSEDWIYTDYAMWLRVSKVFEFFAIRNSYVHYEKSNPDSLSKSVVSNLYNLRMVYQDYEAWLAENKLGSDLGYKLNKNLSLINAKFHKYKNFRI